jgi:hypothetical protein
MGRLSMRKIGHLGVKELWSLVRDPVMLVLIVYTSTDGVWMAATAPPETRSRAALAIVDEDHSPLSLHIRGAFAPPYFLAPVLTTLDQADVLLDRGRATFVLVIPAGFQRRVLAGARQRAAVQRRRHAHESGLYRERLHPRDRAGRGADLPPARTQGAGRADRDGPARPLQSGADAVLVRRPDGNGEQHHHALGNTDRRRPDPRARARHHRAPAGDAGVPARDHAGQAVGDGGGGAGGVAGGARRCIAHLAARRRAGLDPAVPGGRRTAPVRLASCWPRGRAACRSSASWRSWCCCR